MPSEALWGNRWREVKWTCGCNWGATPCDLRNCQCDRTCLEIWVKAYGFCILEGTRLGGAG